MFQWDKGELQIQSPSQTPAPSLTSCATGLHLQTRRYHTKSVGDGIHGAIIQEGASAVPRTRLPDSEWCRLPSPSDFPPAVIL